MQIIRGRIIYGSADWPTIKLRQLILVVKKEQATAHRNMLVAEQKACRDEEKLKDYAKAIRESNDVLAALEQGDEKAWTLADNFLSARAAEYDSIAGKRCRAAIHAHSATHFRAHTSAAPLKLSHGHAGPRFFRAKSRTRLGVTKTSSSVLCR